MRLHQARVLCRERFGNHIRLRYRWEGDTPEPGQFVVVRTENASPRIDPFLPRPFFVHDLEVGVASLLFEVRGAGTRLLAEDGLNLLVSGPLGRGFEFGGLQGGPVALLGGGVWVAPLKLLSRRLTLLQIPHDVYLDVPATAPEAYGGLLKKTYPSATLVPTDGEGGWRVLDAVGALDRYRAVFASGTSGMLEAVAVGCRGVVPAQVAWRERMACADGSCFGCAVPLSDGGFGRACVDGPVFAVEELAGARGS